MSLPPPPPPKRAAPPPSCQLVSPGGPGRGRGRGRARGIPAPYLDRNPPALPRRGGGRSLAASAALRSAGLPRLRRRGDGEAAEQRGGRAAPSEVLAPTRPAAPPTRTLLIVARGLLSQSLRLPPSHSPPLPSPGRTSPSHRLLGVRRSLVRPLRPLPKRPSALSTLLPATLLSPLPHPPLLSLSSADGVSLRGLRGSFLAPKDSIQGEGRGLGRV